MRACITFRCVSTWLFCRRGFNQFLLIMLPGILEDGGKDPPLHLLVQHVSSGALPLSTLPTRAKWYPVIIWGHVMQRSSRSSFLAWPGMAEATRRGLTPSPPPQRRSWLEAVLPPPSASPSLVPLLLVVLVGLSSRSESRHVTANVTAILPGVHTTQPARSRHLP